MPWPRIPPKQARKQAELVATQSGKPFPARPATHSADRMPIIHIRWSSWTRVTRAPGRVRWSEPEACATDEKTVAYASGSDRLRAGAGYKAAPTSWAWQVLLPDAGAGPPGRTAATCRSIQSMQSWLL